MLEDLIPLFQVDALSKMMMGLVAFVASLVWAFARRYLQGDRQYSRFTWQLLLMCASVMLTISADNLLVFFSAWCLSNLLLVLLMVHKAEWRAARASGWLATRTFCLGAVFLGSGFFLLYRMTGELSIHKIIHLSTFFGSEQVLLTLPLSFILLAAMSQSAIWPFHRWLLSSLNSPTPVSAIMHAGLINGGGLLLVRFAPLYLVESNLLLVIFTLGLATAVVGTLWKLLQQDIKRMLACSTMAQMGFMLLQCGLGFFPAAVAHLCWHGLFKATLFLGAGSAAQDKKDLVAIPPSFTRLVAALCCGLLGSYSFAFTSGKEWFAMDSTLVLIGLAFLSTAQLALIVLQSVRWQDLWVTPLLSTLGGACYGWSVFTATHWLDALPLSAAQPLHIVHIIGLLLLVFAWLAMLYRSQLTQSSFLKDAIKPGYVRLLNASQPHPATVTTHRNHYHY
jgi:NAD(P)H-quinone oxidoreductase subunit 5